MDGPEVRNSINGAIMHPILYFEGNNIKDEGKQENICASEY